MKTNKITCVCFCIGISISSMKAQSNTVSAGGEASSSANGTVSFTIGQLDFQYTSGTGGSNSEGVQQTYQVQSNGLVDSELIQVAIWPNPTSDVISIQIHESMLNRMLMLIDAEGKCVLHQLLTERNTCLDLASFSSGYYTLCIDFENNAAYKIIKTP